MKPALTILAVLILIGCSRSPESKLRHYIVDQNQEYVEAAMKELKAHFPADVISQYAFTSTSADFRPNKEKSTVGCVYVLFEKNGTRKQTQLSEKEFSETFDSIQVNFELFDSYKRIEFMISEGGKATVKEAFVVHHPKTQ